MSVSSAATLISPSNSRGAAPSTSQRRPAAHSHHTTHSTHAHHTVKRRASTHGHGSGRRSSESEHGRRALAAGLAMHAMDPATAGTTKPAPKKRNSGDRPLTKTSRSDTHLPRLSRTTSITSVASQTSSTSATSRPGKSGRKRSGETVQVLNEEGQGAKDVDADVEEEEEWEDGEDAPKAKSNEMRRTVSDTSADPKGKQRRHSHHPSISAILSSGNLVDTPLEAPNPTLSSTRKTTGFAGSVQPPDPQVAAQLPSAEAHHPVISNPIRRVASTKSLVGPIAIESSSDAGVATESPLEYKEEGEHDVKTDVAAAPSGPARLRSTDGSGLPLVNHEQENKAASTSPSYPFPQMIPPPSQPTSASKASAAAPPKDQNNTPPSSASISHPRSRQTSNPNGHVLRHRYSNSSLRSIQSLRAPPHPLNSPTGYRTGMQGSRPGSNFASPSKNGEKRERVPSMHQPPVPQPQVSYELAQGHGWDELSENEVSRRRTTPIPSSSNPTAKSNGATSSQSMRKSSISSNRSVRSIFAGTLNTPTTSSTTITPIAETSPHPPYRRLTALEAASAASKRNTTTDPALYHHSLGHSTTSAETSFLISRFLPQKKVRRPEWEIDLRDPDQVENPRVGLTNGDYRESHESLVRTFRELGLSSGLGGSSTSINQGKRGISRSYSGYNLLTGSNSMTVSSSGSGGGQDEFVQGQGLGVIRGRDGRGLMVSKGSFGGKTPFEMSVERCLAQRPGRVIA
ncbi:hypothetical protein IAR55_001585 [Kwoniella newhampshirensis]|uniref:Uncharacterized protein n=1 Tax=Kwoniella newhampshirensis TaxID=1651941 RepID=A0AAW0Z2I6_9TREE